MGILMIRKTTILYKKLPVLNVKCNYDDYNDVTDFLLPDQSSGCILSHHQSLCPAKLFSHRTKGKKKSQDDIVTPILETSAIQSNWDFQRSNILCSSSTDRSIQQ